MPFVLDTFVVTATLAGSYSVTLKVEVTRLPKRFFQDGIELDL